MKSKRGAIIFLPKNRKGQLTIFIIIAMVIVAVGILIYSFWPQIKSVLGGEAGNPQAFIQGCVEKEIEDAVEIISLQGGSVEPDSFYTYEGNKIEYLCYQNQGYASYCVVQQPFLKQHIESEIKNEIADAVESCFESMREIGSFFDITSDAILNSSGRIFDFLSKSRKYCFTSSSLSPAAAHAALRSAREFTRMTKSFSVAPNDFNISDASRMISISASPSGRPTRSISA